MTLGFARQLLVLGVALSLWASVGRPRLLPALLCYLVAIALVSSPPARALFHALSPRAVALLALLFSAPGLAYGLSIHRTLAEHEGLQGLGTQLVDRLRLEAQPSIAPALVASDRPQAFFVHAPSAQHIQVRFSPKASAVAGEAMGHGLFRVDYDPRRHGVPSAQEGKAQIAIVEDGREIIRELLASTPFSHPRWLAVSPARTHVAAVSEETDELFVLNAHGLVTLAEVGDGPSDALFLDDERILVSHLDDPNLYVIRAQDGRLLGKVSVGMRQARLAKSPDGRMIAVALAGLHPALALLSSDEVKVSARVPLEATPDWLTFGADAQTLIVSTRRPAQILRLRAGAQGYHIDHTLPLLRPVVALAPDNKGSQVLFAVTDYPEDGQSHVGNHFVQDQLLTLQIETMSITETWLTARRSARQSKPGDVDRGLSPMGIARGADGTWLVTFAGSDELWRAKGAASRPNIRDLVDTPLHAPHGAAELADGTVVVSSPSSGALGLFAPGSDRPRLIRLAPDEEALLARDRVLLAQRVGERGFYEGTRSGISCQSCHLHADSDDAAHNLGGYKLVPTLSVRGIAGTAPYLRDGSYPRIADLDELSQTLYRGYLRSQGARGETLEAYISSLPRNRARAVAADRNPAGEKRGLDAFVKAGCVTCHAFPAFTNLGSLPMHVLFPDESEKHREREQLDTPSLLSLASSAPYLDNGRAATLEDLLTTHNLRNRHGDTQSLSEAERSDLVTFLLSL